MEVKTEVSNDDDIALVHRALEELGLSETQSRSLYEHVSQRVSPLLTPRVQRPPPRTPGDDSLGERLRRERKRLRLTQEGFSNLLGASRSQIALWETNRSTPTLDYYATAKDNGVDVWFLLNGDTDPEERTSAFDWKLLQTIASSCEEICAEKGLLLPVEKETMIYKMLYVSSARSGQFDRKMAIDLLQLSGTTRNS